MAPLARRPAAAGGRGGTAVRFAPRGDAFGDVRARVGRGVLRDRRRLAYLNAGLRLELDLRGAPPRSVLRAPAAAASTAARW